MEQYFEPMSNVAICTPTTGVVKATYTASLMAMVGHYLQNPVWDEDEQKFISFQLLIGSSIAEQREAMVDESLRDPTCTHVLFIDDDMGWQADALNLALYRKKPVVLANYRKKTRPWSFTARRIEREGDKLRAVEIVTDELSKGLEPVDFGGFGFCLVETALLRQLKKPRFLVQWIPEQQRYSTEDYPFFRQIQELGVEVCVDHELSRKVIHIGDFQYHYGGTPEGKPVLVRAEAPVLQEYKVA